MNAMGKITIIFKSSVTTRLCNQLQPDQIMKSSSAINCSELLLRSSTTSSSKSAKSESSKYCYNLNPVLQKGNEEFWFHEHFSLKIRINFIIFYRYY